MKRANSSNQPPFPPGTRVLARLHPTEVSRGIFISGHRFEPLRNASLPPWLVDIEEAGGQALESRNVGLSLSDALVFYRLFGESAAPYLLLGQSDANRKALERGADAIVRIIAFDAAAFYARHGLAAGDYVSLSLLDGSGERFSLAPLRAADIDDDRRREFFAALASAAEAALEARSAPLDPISCIREIFSRCPASVLSDPMGSFSEFYNEGGLLELRDFGGVSFMCRKGEALAESMMGEPEPPRGVTELEEALIEAGLSLTEDEVEAFIRDALYHGRPAGEGLERAFGGVDGLGLPKRLRARLERLSLALSERVEEDYDPDEDSRDLAELRSDLLALYGGFLAWMRRVGSWISSPEELETEEFSTLMQLMRHVAQVIALTNDFYDEEEEEEEEDDDDMGPEAFLAEAMASIPDLEADAGRLMHEIELSLARPRLATRSPPARARRSSLRPVSRKAYIFRARLLDLEPPITRELYVPGNRTLAELHAIIQTAFGWTDSHLHLFLWKGATYAPPDPDDFEPVLDEADYRLDDLNPRKGGRIEYVYDYGDEWRHELVVAHWMKPRDGDFDYPICLSGARSAPPEDSGGQPGYESLIEARAKPPRARSDDEKELLAWAGRWNPEAFDLERVNARLARMR